MPRPTIPDVELQAEIGRGGMGVVYRGRQTYLDRNVAVKLLLLDRAGGDDDYLKRFQREAKILAGLAHPHIVGCYSAGMADGNPYLVMEFIDGPDLRGWIGKQGALTQEQALTVTRDIAKALEHANGLGIIHRDVKPENVLLAKRENAAADDPFPFQAKLVDLGLARPQRTGGEMNLTQQGAVMGTPATMAPEQFDDPDNIDFRADIYGLGCVLFHALTGHPAFTGKSLAQIVSAKVSGEVPSLTTEVRDLRRGVSDLTADLLARDKSKRPQSYAELIRRCDELLAGRAAPSRAKRMPLIVGALVAVVAIVAGVIVASDGKKAAPVTSPVTSPVASAQPSGVVPQAAVPKAIDFGAPRPLDLASDFLNQVGGWARIGEAVWVVSEEAEHTIVGQSGRIERPLDQGAVQIDGVLHLTTGGKGTRELAVGVVLDDGSALSLAIKNTDLFTAQVEIVKGDQPSRLERNQSIPVEDAPFTITVTDGVFAVVVSKLKLNPIPIPGVAKKLFLSVVGPGAATVNKLTVRYPKP